MHYVNITKLRKNLKHYIELSKDEDIYVTSNNEVVAVISNPKDKAFNELLSYFGCLKESDDGKPYDEILFEEIMKH